MQPVLINERVESIKNDDEAVNRFVEEFKPFIASCSEKVTGRYMRYGEDDELSIALMAFAEAIKSYDSSKGSFLSFAQNVIKRRLVDFFRKERRHSNVVSLDEYSTEEGEEFDLSAADSIERHSAEVVSEYRRLEIEELKNELMQWGISILADESPDRKYTSQVVSPIISEGDPIGAVILLSTDPNTHMGEVEAKLAQSAAGFLGKQMEQ
jgi:RNA polymerase sigma factor